jgi:hypothetical protein
MPASVHCAKALFSAENGLDSAVTESALHVAVVPAESGSESLKDRAEDEIAAEFQPLPLEYRLRNHRAVSQSTFDVPEFTPGLRDFARSLGAAIVGDAELAGRIASLAYAPGWRRPRARRSVLPEGAILTVALALVQERKLKHVLSKDLTQLVNAALRANGQIVESPEEIGWRLSRLGLYTHRMAGGNGIRLDRNSGVPRTISPGNFGRRCCLLLPNAPTVRMPRKL